jgi:hypothetical protein
MWVLDHHEDIDSDMSVFHRVDDYGSMPAPKFFARAARLPVYQGVLREVMAPEATDQPAATPAHNGAVGVDVRQLALAAPDWIEIARG